MKLVRMYKLFTIMILINTSLSLYAMKRPAEEIEELEEQKPAKVPAIAPQEPEEMIIEEEKKEPEVSPKPNLTLTIPAELSYLPKDLKTYILAFLTTGVGATELERLDSAVENIRNFMMLNKNFNTFLNDPSLNKFLVRELAKNYIAEDPDRVTDEDLEEAVIALRTPGAVAWLIQASGIINLPQQEQPLILPTPFAQWAMQPVSAAPKGENKVPINDLEKAIIKYLFMAYSEGEIEKVRFYVKTMPTLLWAENSVQNLTFANGRVQGVAGETLFKLALRVGDLPLLILAKDALEKLINEKKLVIRPASFFNLFCINKESQGPSPLVLAIHSGNVALFDFVYTWINQLKERFLILSQNNQQAQKNIRKALNAVQMIDNDFARYRGEPVLCYAIRANNLAMVNRLLALPSEGLPAAKLLVNQISNRPFFYATVENREIKTPLMLAVQLGRVEIVKELVQIPGIYFNMKDQNGNTALLIAIKNAIDWGLKPDERQHFIEIIRLLLEAPTVDVNVSNKYGQTALSLVKIVKKGEISEYQQLSGDTEQKKQAFSMPDSEDIAQTKELIFKMLKEQNIKLKGKTNEASKNI